MIRLLREAVSKHFNTNLPCSPNFSEFAKAGKSSFEYVPNQRTAIKPLVWENEAIVAQRDIVHRLRGNFLASKSTSAKEAFKDAMKALELLYKENYEKT
jgi:hypothetical protein